MTDLSLSEEARKGGPNVKPAIVLNHVTKRYNQNEAVKDVSLTIEQGSIVALLGANGAGKTTTISMLLGLTKPSSGSIQVLGGNPAHPDARRFIGAMLQQVEMVQKVKVREVIDLFRSYYPTPIPTIDLLKMAGLTTEANKQADRLSGGQQRRLQYALAMAGDPRLLFLDEPTTGMDITSRREFWANLRSVFREDGRTLILTTHHLEEAESIADRIVLMQRGQVLADGSVKELKAKTGFSYVSCTLQPQASADVLQTLHHAEGIEISGRQVRIKTKDADAILRALIFDRYPVEHFEVTTGRLEDAFISLTSEEQSNEIEGAV